MLQSLCLCYQKEHVSSVCTYSTQLHSWLATNGAVLGCFVISFGILMTVVKYVEIHNLINLCTFSFNYSENVI